MIVSIKLILIYLTLTKNNLQEGGLSMILLKFFVDLLSNNKIQLTRTKIIDKI